MKGTIFERGNKVSNKINRELAWIRVKKYWLFMSHKEYKKNLFYQVIGIFTWFFGLWAALWLGVEKLIEWWTNRK